MNRQMLFGRVMAPYSGRMIKPQSNHCLSCAAFSLTNLPFPAAFLQSGRILPSVIVFYQTIYTWQDGPNMSWVLKYTQA